MYCIALFLMHAERMYEMGAYDMSHTRRALPHDDARRWFDAAGDHLEEMVVPMNAGGRIVEMVEDLRTTTARGRREGSWDDVEHAILVAKRITFAWDVANGVDAVLGEWE